MIDRYSLFSIRFMFGVIYFQRWKRALCMLSYLAACFSGMSSYMPLTPSLLASGLHGMASQSEPCSPVPSLQMSSPAPIRRPDRNSRTSTTTGFDFASDSWLWVPCTAPNYLLSVKAAPLCLQSLPAFDRTRPFLFTFPSRRSLPSGLIGLITSPPNAPQDFHKPDWE